MKRSWMLRLLKTFSFTLILVGSVTAYADDDDTWASVFDAPRDVHRIFSLGYGKSLTNDIGKHSQFSILDPVSDELYVYKPYRSTQNTEIFNAYLGVEWMFLPKWHMQVGADFTQSRDFVASGDLLKGPDLQSADTFHYSYLITTRQFIGIGKLLYQYHDIYYPYILAGVGISANDARNFRTDIPQNVTYARTYKDHVETSLTYALGLGFDIEVANNLRVGLSYRYTNLGRASLGSAFINGIYVPGTLSETSLHTHLFLAQASLLF